MVEVQAFDCSLWDQFAEGEDVRHMARALLALDVVPVHIREHLTVTCDEDTGVPAGLCYAHWDGRSFSLYPAKTDGKLCFVAEVDGQGVCK